MLLDVVIAVCAAFAAGGTVYGAVRLFGRRPPKWLIPAIAAIAIVGVTAYQRYDWHRRVIALLPPEMVVVQTLSTSVWVEPWSLIAPVVSSVVAVDTASVKRNAGHPGMVLVDLVVVSRDSDTTVVRHVVDCVGHRLAPLPAEVAFGVDGLPEAPDWRTGAPDALFRAVCTP